MNPLEKAQDLVKQYQRGYQKADITQRQMIKQGLGYGESVLDPRFKSEIAKRGISARETPAQFLGAYTSRLLIDAAGNLLWCYLLSFFFIVF